MDRLVDIDIPPPSYNEVIEADIEKMKPDTMLHHDELLDHSRLPTEFPSIPSRERKCCNKKIKICCILLVFLRLA